MADKRPTKNINFRIAVFVVVAFVIVCFGSIAIEAQFKIFRRVIDDVVYDNKNHYLPCKKLPIEGEVVAVLEQHQDLVREIEGVNPGLVGIDIDTSCPGKADLVIWYASHGDRLEIEQILGADTFFGIPYRLNNR